MMKTVFTFLTGFYLMLFSVVGATAESDKLASAKTLSSSPITSGALMETILGLLLVISCIAFLAWLLRRTGQFNSAANGEMKIIAGLSLGTREKAMLLQVGKQQILVGVTTQQVRTLHVLEQNIDTSSEASTSSFANKLQQIMKQQDKS